MAPFDRGSRAVECPANVGCKNHLGRAGLTWRRCGRERLVGRIRMSGLVCQRLSPNEPLTPTRAADPIGSKLPHLNCQPTRRTARSRRAQTAFPGRSSCASGMLDGTGDRWSSARSEKHREPHDWGSGSRTPGRALVTRPSQSRLDFARTAELSRGGPGPAGASPRPPAQFARSARRPSR